MRTTVLAILIGLSCCLSVGCGGAAPPPAAASSAALKAPGTAQVGDKTKCPVSGEEFVVKADSPKVDFEGKTYYFCCPHCVQQFQADPKKYASKPAT